MIQRSVAQIANMIKVENDWKAFEQVQINGVAIDSRKANENCLFIPFIGERVDGHQYVRCVIESGSAAASLWDKKVPNPPLDLPILIVEDVLLAFQELAAAYRQQLSVKVIGVTGSNGKTTMKDMLTSLLGTVYRVQKTEGNYNNHIGLPYTILSLREDTEISVLEMGMSGKGEIELLSKISNPDVAIITNIGESHMLDLGSREGIADAKLEIISGLKEEGFLAYYGQEPLLEERIKGNPTIRALTFGLTENMDLYPTELEQTESGSNFEVNQAEGIRFELPVLGMHNVTNALGAILVSNIMGAPFNHMKTGLRNLVLTSMRMERSQGPNGSTLINDAYNASPTSMTAAIQLLAELKGYEQKILVVGDMLELGSNEEDFHRQVGRAIPKGKIDAIFSFGALSKLIADEALKNGLSKTFFFTDKKELANGLLPLLTSKTVVLFKASRGMALEEVIQEMLH
jgi:UDP-N-acetylmuramoyl-tripeptide--D-alanyl-D-alanine ligase